LGYSNGANVAVAILVLHPHILSGAVLLRAMAPFINMPRADLAQKPVLLLTGDQDRMITRAGTENLASALRESGAKLTHSWLPTGHGLTQTDITATTSFLNSEA
jgi:phospholipase/carboxylesterase